MISEMKITGVNEIKLNLDRLDKSVIEDVQKALTEGADIVTKRTRDKIRSNFKTKTGNLADSPITRSMPQKLGWALVSISAIDRKKAPHAHLHEYGTSRMPARPFQRPAFDQSKSEIEKLIDNALSGAVRRHA
jgi:HK97 gp10 family phage protein